jgi:hypothetical protein
MLFEYLLGPASGMESSHTQGKLSIPSGYTGNTWLHACVHRMYAELTWDCTPLTMML